MKNSLYNHYEFVNKIISVDAGPKVLNKFLGKQFMQMSNTQLGITPEQRKKLEDLKKNL